eukprot:2022496-Alexandrium_andersonii.AAC.1
MCTAIHNPRIRNPAIRNPANHCRLGCIRPVSLPRGAPVFSGGTYRTPTKGYLPALTPNWHRAH